MMQYAILFLLLLVGAAQATDLRGPIGHPNSTTSDTVIYPASSLTGGVGGGGGGGGSPPGGNTEVIYNDTGAFGTDTGFVYNKTSNIMSTAGGLATGNLGLEVLASDTNPGCSGGVYNIFADLSEAKWKKCQNGLTSDLSVAGVSSVGLTAPLQFTITGSPVTTSGDLGLAWANASTNFGLFGPASGGAAAPTFRAMVKADTPSTTVHTDQSNTYTTGTQDMGGSASFRVPSFVGASPTLSGHINYDITSDTLEFGRAGVNEIIATLNDITNLSHGGLTNNDIDSSGHPLIYVRYEATAGLPPAGSCDRAGQIQFDTTGTRIYGCYSAGGNPIDPGGQSDSVTGCSDGTNSCTVTGSESWLFARASGLGTEVEVFNGTGTFGTQPSNDTVELVSSSPSDTGSKTFTIYGTTNGSDQSNIILETIALNGTTPVTTVKTDWGKIYAIKQAAGAALVGTLTIREGSGDVTITTMAPAATRAANQDTIIYKAAGGGGGSSTEYVQMRLDTVEDGDNNAIALPLFGTNLNDAVVRYADNVTGISWWSAYIPVASTVQTMVLHNKPASGTGTAVSLEIMCRVVANNVAKDSTMTWVFGASANPAEITVSSTSANLNVNTIATTLTLTARSRLFCGVKRVGGDANDNLSASWDLSGVALEITP